MKTTSLCKALLLSFILMPIWGYARDCDCDFVITPDNYKLKYNASSDKISGNTICIKGGIYERIWFEGFQGTSKNPITIINCKGKVIFRHDKNPHGGFNFINCSFIRLTGSGDPSITYGFKVENTLRGSGVSFNTFSNNIEIDHVEIANTNFAGLVIKTDPTCDDPRTWRDNFRMENVSVHDNYIHDTRGEGVYIGYTTNLKCGSNTIYGHDIKNLKVYNNIVERTGWDGIQIANSTEGCEIYNNKIRNYATRNAGSHKHGLLMGGYTSGRVYNNFIENGSGPGITTFGFGDVYVYNNVIVGAGDFGIFCDDRSTDPSKGFYFINNTIIRPGENGIRMYSYQSKGNVFYNNLIVDPGAYNNYERLTSWWGTGKDAFIYINKVAKKIDFDSAGNYFSRDINSLNFKNSKNGDYSLLAGSLAINKGINVSSYGVTKDFLNAGRPSGGKFDAGAFEFGSSAPQPEPEEPPQDENPGEGGAANGLTYSYYEGNWSSLPDFNSLTAKTKGKISKVNLSIIERNDYFAVKYEGFIKIEKAGSYTFYLNSDDGSRLYINNDLVIDHNGLHAASEKSGSINLTVGLHPVRIEYFEKTGEEQLSLFYQTSGTPKKEVPSQMFEAGNAAPVSKNLNYNYYEGSWTSLPDFSALQPIASGKTGNVNLDIKKRNDNFGIVFYGMIQIDKGGLYKFFLKSDDGSRLYINGKLVIDHDGQHATSEKSGSMNLSEGLHSVRVEYFEKLWDEYLTLFYEGPSIVKREVPNEKLFSDNVVAEPMADGLRYSYFEGSWSNMPDFSKLKPVANGTVSNFVLDPRTRSDNFGFLFEGYLTIPSDGIYTFSVNSDDGTKLYLDGIELINNDGLHPLKKETAQKQLTKGKHQIKVEFFERTGEEILEVKISGKDLPEQKIPNSWLSHEKAIDARIAVSTPLSYGISVYPNPFDEMITVAIDGDSERAWLKLVDFNGRIIDEKEYLIGHSVRHIRFEAPANLSRGIYFLSIRTDHSEHRTIKLIKK